MTIVRLAVIPVWNPGKRMVSSQCPEVSSQCSFFCHPSAQTLGSRRLDSNQVAA
ncbi:MULTISPECIES: hypothetical protein [unclassified Wolbachia]|uniref:hypothetical protein n=1 Tax=unclassified Wolbachia TaxID=2640676 RepID=UPI0022321F2C|nr:hypothetical protein [Wolbachia endosymbiont (group A) of Apoderus coryli]